jgi:hypothetical protein
MVVNSRKPGRGPESNLAPARSVSETRSRRTCQSGAPYRAVLLARSETGRRDLPALARLEEAGLLGKAPLPEELRGALGIRDDDEDGAEINAGEDGERAGLRRSARGCHSSRGWGKCPALGSGMAARERYPNASSLL